MASYSYATVEDVITLWRPLTTGEQDRVSALLPIVSDGLRAEAKKVGKDLDTMVEEELGLENVAKAVTVDVIARIMRQSTDSEPLSQESQSALGYSWSGTYAIPGGGMANAIMNNDLKRLGLRRQRFGTIDLYGSGNYE